MDNKPLLVAFVIVFLAILGFLVYFLVFKNDDSTDSKCSAGQYKKDGTCTQCTDVRACKTDTIIACTSDADASCTECTTDLLFDNQKNCAAKDINTQTILNILENAAVNPDKLPSTDQFMLYLEYVLGTTAYSNCTTDFEKIPDLYQEIKDKIDDVKNCIEKQTDNCNPSAIKEILSTFKENVQTAGKNILLALKDKDVDEIQNQLNAISEAVTGAVDAINEACSDGAVSCLQDVTQAENDLIAAITAFKDCLDGLKS